MIKFSQTSQQEILEELSFFVQLAFSKCNTSVFAYDQTDSSKTCIMMEKER